MKNFTYFRPTTAEQAVSLLQAQYGNTEMLAGGTDLLSLQKDYIAQPGRVVSLGGIAGLQTVTVGERTVTVGAGVTLATIAALRHGIDAQLPFFSALGKNNCWPSIL